MTDARPPLPIEARIAVIIPCYKVRGHIQDVISRMPDLVGAIYCVDDACPEHSADHIEQCCTDRRVRLVRRPVNGGVGAATMSGYRAAIADGFEILVKVDGDGQMPPELIPVICQPILAGNADYVKGNRFFNIEDVSAMPARRLLGNAALSFISKLSTGYWDIFDPTNGFTALHARLAERMPMAKMAQRYFFESDMLFRLNTLGARVYDIPMSAVYGDEQSNLKISSVFWTFAFGNLRNFVKRIFYTYFLRDFSLGSLYLMLAVLLACIGSVLGIVFWIDSIHLGIPATPGKVMFSALPLIFALQLFLYFFGYDMTRVPQRAIHPALPALPPERMG